jgi:hypothetical protein
VVDDRWAGALATPFVWAVAHVQIADPTDRYMKTWHADCGPVGATLDCAELPANRKQSRPSRDSHDCASLRLQATACGPAACCSYVLLVRDAGTGLAAQPLVCLELEMVAAVVGLPACLRLFATRHAVREDGLDLCAGPGWLPRVHGAARLALRSHDGRVLAARLRFVRDGNVLGYTVERVVGQAPVLIPIGTVVYGRNDENAAAGDGPGSAAAQMAAEAGRVGQPYQLVLRYRRSVLCGELRAALGFRSSSGGGADATENEVQWTDSVDLVPDSSYYAAFSDYDFGVVFDDAALAGLEMWAVWLSVGDTAAGVGSWPLAQVVVVRLRDREAFVGEMDEHRDVRGAWGGGDEEDADGLQRVVLLSSGETRHMLESSGPEATASATGKVFAWWQLHRGDEVRHSKQAAAMLQREQKDHDHQEISFGAAGLIFDPVTGLYRVV